VAKDLGCEVWFQPSHWFVFWAVTNPTNNLTTPPKKIMPPIRKIGAHSDVKRLRGRILERSSSTSIDKNEKIIPPVGPEAWEKVNNSAGQQA
jgi:hypothetical protein